jgi:acyl-CoA thioesterase-1
MPVFLAGLVFFLFSPGCAGQRVSNADSRGRNIVCFGDSITLGSAIPAGQRYPDFLAKMTGMPVVNAGINDDTTDQALQRIKTDVLDRDPLLVIMEFGGNDFFSKKPAEETSRNMEEMIKAIQSSGAMVAVVDVSAVMIMEEYGRIFRELCSRYNAIFIPQVLVDVYTDPHLKGPDMVHPNAKGNQIIAHRVYRAILPYLNRNAMLKRLRK